MVWELFIRFEFLLPGKTEFEAFRTGFGTIDHYGHSSGFGLHGVAGKSKVS
jgi:hypothetical protein